MRIGGRIWGQGIGYTKVLEKINSQQDGLLSNFLGPLMRVGLPLMKNVLILLTKSVLMPLRLTAIPSTTDTAIRKKISGSGMTTLII